MFSLAFVIQDHVSIIDEAGVVRSMFLPSNVFSAVKLLDFYLNLSKCNIYFHFLIHAVISLFSFFYQESMNKLHNSDCMLKCNKTMILEGVQMQLFIVSFFGKCLYML